MMAHRVPFIVAELGADAEFVGAPGLPLSSQQPFAGSFDRVVQQGGGPDAGWKD